MQSYTDHCDATPLLLQLPPEVFRHVTRSLRPATLSWLGVACSALRAAVMPEVRGEREARRRLAQLSRGQLGAYGYDDAIAACGRWGLSRERPFAALARRAAVRLMTTATERNEATNRWLWTYTHDPAGPNRLFEEREAPVRAHMVPDHMVPDRGALLVLLPGEALCIRGVRDVPEILVSVNLGRIPRYCVGYKTTPGWWTLRDDGCLQLCICIERRFALRSAQKCIHVTVHLYVEAPCDAEIYAEMISPRNHGDITLNYAAYCDMRLRYAAHVCELWGAPPGSLRPTPNSHAGWDMSGAAWKAARQYYERSGIPVSLLNVRVRVDAIES